MQAANQKDGPWKGRAGRQYQQAGPAEGCSAAVEFLDAKKWRKTERLSGRAETAARQGAVDLIAGSWWLAGACALLGQKRGVGRFAPFRESLFAVLLTVHAG